MTKKLLFVTTLLLALSLAVMAADVSGKWTYEQAGRQGGNPTQVTLTLKAEGGKLTGNVSQPGRNGNMDTAITNGKVDGDKVSFEVVREFNGNQMISKYEGTVAGDE